MKLIKNASGKKVVKMSKKEWTDIGIKQGWFKNLKSENHKKAQDMGRYKSDEDIASEFSGMVINEIQVKPSLSSGWIQLSFPEGGEHVGGGSSEVTDHWVKYDNGQIAFDNWYPTEISNQLIKAIEQEIQEIRLDITECAVCNKTKHIDEMANDEICNDCEEIEQDEQRAGRNFMDSGEYQNYPEFDR